MDGAKSTERRYNTRFRGVPKSTLVNPKPSKKAKTKFPAPLKADFRDDFIYTKLSKKRSPGRQAVEPIIHRVKEIKKEVLSPPPSDTPLDQDEGSPPCSPENKEVEDERPPSPKEEKPILPKDEEIFLEQKEKPVKLQEKLPQQQKKPVKQENLIPQEEKSVHEEDEPVRNEDLSPESPSQHRQQSSPMLLTIVKVSNGVHHSDTEPTEEILSDNEKPHLPPDVEDKDYPQSTFKLVETVKEFVVSGTSGSKSVWITSKEKLSFNNCSVASYNPKTKMFRCIICQAVGFMTRIGEHYLGTHCNTKVFQCPQCPYCSAWWRCVRNHMSKHHGISNAPASMWKNQPLLDEIMQLLQNLKYSVDCEDRVIKVAENSGKRYICPKCPYATDRRDLYNRHENIHREEKPFQCYICYKLFNRADHVKKHFCRIHKDYDYDINLIRRLPSKRSRLPVSQHNGIHSDSPVHQIDSSIITANTVTLSASSNNASSCAVPVTTSGSQTSQCQSKLLNCLTGPPTMVRPSQEVTFSKNDNAGENPKENMFKELPSSLLNYLTRPNFPSKPPLLELPPSNSMCNSQLAEGCCGKQLQEGVLATLGYSRTPGSMPKEFICPYCPFKSTDMWALRMHTATHYNNACVLCNFRSTKESDLETHMWDCHRKRPCNKCDFLADSIMVLDSHIKDMHSKKPTSAGGTFKCRVCSQDFGSRSDMEAHSIFVHNQTLQECKREGCDFCSTDPEVLKEHLREKHHVSSSFSSKTATPSEKTSASRTQCLYCGCDFVDNPSLCLHEEIFHENPLQVAGQRPMDPYACAICGYATPKQLMMMEHLRVHTGQELHCRAGEGCHFQTPYDTVLREHVVQSHSNDDGIVRCPHCGFRCSTRKSFTSHYEQYHHPFCCALCEEVEHNYFVSPKSSSFLESTIAALFPFARKVNEASQKVNEEKRHSGMNRLQVPHMPKDAIIVETVRRSRKQSQPRKVIQDGPPKKGKRASSSALSPSSSSSSSNVKKRKTVNNKSHSDSFISLYAKRHKKPVPDQTLRCWLCAKRPVYFHQRKSFIFHTSWHHSQRQHCQKCVQTFRYRYQVLLHMKREHRD